MGAIPAHANFWEFPYLNKTGRNSERKIYEDKNIKYTSSWDWLMPVIEKIEQDEYTLIEIGKKSCTIYMGVPAFPQGIDWKCPIIQQLNNKRMSVIYAILEYIRQYNIKQLNIN